MTRKKVPHKHGKAGPKKTPGKAKKRRSPRRRRPAGQVLKHGRPSHQTTGSRRLPRTRRATKRHQGAIRRPAPKLVPRRRERPKLRRLTGVQRRTVDTLLLKVYQHAARELTALETKDRGAARAQDQKVADRYGAARDELMRALADWERRQKPEET
jgi:hypothetical protein